MNSTHLGVSDEDDLRVRAPRVEVVDGLRNGGRARDGGLGVASASAGSLTAAGRVGDGLSLGTGIGVEDQVNDDPSSAVPGRSSGLTGSEDLYARAALTLFERERRGESLSSEEESSGGPEHRDGLKSA